MHDPWTLLAAFVVGTIAVARAARLVTADSWPPASWFRMRWLTWTANGGEWRRDWTDLFTCPFCFAPYAAAVDLGWAWLADPRTTGSWAQTWWLVNLWAAVSYLAAMIVVRDEPPAEDA